MKLIKWIDVDGKENKELFVNHGNGWFHYSQLAVPIDDYKIQGGSAGFRAMQVLLRQGYEYVRSEV